jgi:hypothetical protein
VPLCVLQGWSGVKVGEVWPAKAGCLRVPYGCLGGVGGTAATLCLILHDGPGACPGRLWVCTLSSPCSLVALVPAPGSMWPLWSAWGVSFLVSCMLTVFWPMCWRARYTRVCGVRVQGHAPVQQQGVLHFQLCAIYWTAHRVGANKAATQVRLHECFRQRPPNQVSEALG